jgi:hypothetical protein
MVIERAKTAENLTLNEAPSTSAKTGAQKCLRKPAITSTTFADIPNCDYPDPSSPLPSVYGIRSAAS